MMVKLVERDSNSLYFAWPNNYVRWPFNMLKFIGFSVQLSYIS